LILLVKTKGIYICIGWSNKYYITVIQNIEICQNMLLITYVVL